MSRVCFLQSLPCSNVIPELEQFSHRFQKSKLSFVLYVCVQIFGRYDRIGPKRTPKQTESSV